MIVEDMKKKIEDLDYAKRAVRRLLDNDGSLVDLHGLVYWATRVNELRNEIKSDL